MNWSDESWVKLYRRVEPTWAVLSLEARGLFCELLRRCDRAGRLNLGSKPAAAVAAVVNCQADTAEKRLQELADDGCIKIEDGVLCIRNYVEAQSAISSPAARQRAKRERVRAMVASDFDSDLYDCVDDPSRDVTQSHAESRGVTPESREVTNKNRIDLLHVCSARVDTDQGEVTHAQRPPLGVPIPEALQGERFEALWRAWVDEKRRKKPLSIVQAERLLYKLARSGQVKAIEILDAALCNGWGTLVWPEDRSASQAAPGSTKGDRPRSSHDEEYITQQKAAQALRRTAEQSAAREVERAPPQVAASHIKDILKRIGAEEE